MPVKTTVRSRGSLIIHDLGHIFFLSSLRGEKHPVNIGVINISWALYCSTTPALSKHVSRRLKNNFPFFPTFFYPNLNTFLLQNSLSYFYFSVIMSAYYFFAYSKSENTPSLGLSGHIWLRGLSYILWLINFFPRVNRMMTHCCWWEQHCR